MNQYEIKVKYSKINEEGVVIEKSMVFVASGNSLDEARITAQETATPFINKVNGTFVSAE